MRRLLLPLVIAALLPGCGSSRDGLLREGEAERLTKVVDDVDRAVGRQDCETAEQRAEEGAELAAEVSRHVNRRLKRNLRDWFQHLAAEVRQECEPEEPEEPEETATPSPTASPTSSPTPTATPTATSTPLPTATATPSPEDGDGSGGVAPDLGGGE